MAKLKITKGEWRFSTAVGSIVTTSPIGIQEGSKEICSISEFGKSVSEVHDNGKLIAAAPDLLKACIALYGAIQEDEPEYIKYALRIGKMAIDKAKSIM